MSKWDQQWPPKCYDSPVILQHACNKHCDRSSYHRDTMCPIQCNHTLHLVCSHAYKSNDTIRVCCYIRNFRRTAQCPFRTRRCRDILGAGTRAPATVSSNRRNVHPHNRMGMDRIGILAPGFRTQRADHMAGSNHTIHGPHSMAMD